MNEQLRRSRQAKCLTTITDILNFRHLLMAVCIELASMVWQPYRDFHARRPTMF